MVDLVNLSEHLPYQDLFKSGIMRLSGNGLMGMIEYRGVDYERTPNHALLNMSNRIASYIANFGRQSGWTINTDTVLVEAAPYLSSPAWLGGETFTSSATGVSRYLHDVRAARFAGQLSDERSFISISMRPSKDRSILLEKAIKKGVVQKNKHWLPYLEGATQTLDALLYGLRREVEPHGFARKMDADAVLRFMSFAITGEEDESLRFPSGVASWPFHRLVDRLLILGRQVRIDGRPVRHVRSIGVAGCPPHHTPEMMAALMRCGHPLRISQRFKVSEADTVHNHYREGLKASKDEQRSIIGHIAELLPSTRGKLEPDAINMAKTIQSTIEAQDTARIKSGGTLTTNVLVYAQTWKEADARADAVLKVIKKDIGFHGIIENANSRNAYLASFPGEIERNRRCDVLPDDFLARRMRITAPWPGNIKSRSPWGGAPLIQATTEGNAKFMFDPWGVDWGHMVGLGANGSGKSTDASFFGHMFLACHPAGKIIQIDADSNLSTSVVAALAAGGKIVSLNHGGVSIQPLRDLDNGDVFAAKVGWIQSICLVQGIQLSPQLNDDIIDGLTLLRSEPPHRRTMNQLYRLAPSPDLRKALKAYSGSGPYASLVNGTSNPFEGSPWTVIELGRFAEKKSPLDEPIISAVLYEVEHAIDNINPTFLIIDEARMCVRAMGESLAVDYAARMRKKNCILLFLFHFIDQDFVNLVAALREQCAWRLFFPNQKATESGARKWMEPLGVTDTMAKLLSMAPKGCVAGIHGQHARMFDLALGKEELAICGVNGADRNASAVELFNRVGPGMFWIEHLKSEGITIDEDRYLEGKETTRYAAE